MGPMRLSFNQGDDLNHSLGPTGPGPGLDRAEWTQGAGDG